jgi:hypothetical protein
LSNRIALQRYILFVAAVMKLPRTSWLVIALSLVLGVPSISLAREKSVASEFLEENIQNGMVAADIVALLDQTVGTAAASGATSAVAHKLRDGLYVTAIPRRANIILRFEVDRSDTKQRYILAEVAVSADLGSKFFQFVKAALGSAESFFSTEHSGQPWELALNAESKSGGQVTVKVEGDATANFTLSWEIASPDRPLDSFVVPTAFGAKEAGTAHISVVVHFPTSLQQFTFLSTIYTGAVGDLFQDLALSPHTWLHLTVTVRSNRVVDVHFDGITTNNQRLFVAEAPASTDVGGRFLDETLKRMQEMLNQEAAQPGSSGKWQTEFYYDDPDKGVIVVAVTGEQGAFDVAYHLETPTESVKSHGKATDD